MMIKHFKNEDNGLENRLKKEYIVFENDTKFPYGKTSSTRIQLKYDIQSNTMQDNYE